MGEINGLETNGAVCFISGTSSSVSVTAGNITFIDSIFIPGGSFKDNDVIQIQSAITKGSTNTSTTTLYIYWNETPDISSPVTIATSVGSEEYIPIHRMVSIESNTRTVLVGTGEIRPADFGDVQGQTVTTLSTITAIDWSLDAYIIVAVSTASVNQTITKRYLTIIN